jgi:hypothetical protein
LKQHHGVKRGRPTRAAAFGIALAFGLIRFVAWDPPAIGGDLEASWLAVLHEAWARGWSFGSELVFTYGPYAFVDVRMLHPATYWPAVALQTALLGIMTVSLWRLLAPATRSPAAAAALVLLTLEVLVTPREGFYYVLLLLPVFFQWSDAGPSRDGSPTSGRWLLHLSLLACALVALAKFTFLVGLTVVLAALAGDALLLRRRTPWPVVTAVASLLALWLLAGQPLLAIGAYLETSLQLAGGYTEAMSLPGPALEVGAYLAIAGLLLAAQTSLLWPAWGRRSLPAALALAGILFLVFKAAFLRHDWHASIAWATALPLALLLALRGRAVRRRSCALAAGIAGLLTAPFFLRSYVEVAPLQEHYRTPVTAVGQQAAALAAALSGRADLETRWQRSLGELAQRYPLPRVEGSVDLVPHFQSLLIAGGLDYRPRPVFQSQLTFSRGLSRLNARHMEGPRAPQWLFFALAPIDERYPALDESLSYPALLSRYDPIAADASFLRLRRSERPRQAALRRLGSADGELERFLDIPDLGRDALVWAEIELRPRWTGRLRALLFRSPRLALEVEDRAGRTQRYRLLPGVARAGFLLSPRLREAGDLARLYSRHGRESLEAQRLSRMLVGRWQPGDPQDWQPRYRVRFYELQIGEPPAAGS